MTIETQTIASTGVVIDIPLNRLKKSPNNARKTPHRDADIEARAASIAAKGILQPLVVEPEMDAGGQPTGDYLVTIGESRRLAQLLRVKRKEIKKTELVRCIIDTINDPFEISLDENINRSDMHPADQFEAFRTLAEERGFGAEDIGARFGVSAAVVRRRMRLAAVSPALLQKYREDELTLDQLMAFAVTEDHARQEQVFEALSWNRSAQLIRRAMTEEHVRADTKRAVFVGEEAYSLAGGRVLRDLFAEDDGGWFEDPALLDRLALEKLDAIAADLRAQEGWNWAQAAIDFPHDCGLRRVYPRPVERSAEETAQIAALSNAYDGLLAEWDGADETPAEIEARLTELDQALRAFGDGSAFDPADIAIGGLFVSLNSNGTVRVERGFIRPEDEPDEGDQTDEDPAPKDEDEEDAPSPLSERLVADLTAHRTAALGNELAEHPDVAIMALTHALMLRTFYQGEAAGSCLEVRMTLAPLASHAPGIEDTPAGLARAARHAAWAKDVPQDAGAAWAYVSSLTPDQRISLLAHCAGLAVNAVQTWERRPRVMTHAAQVARAVGLDMRRYWSPTAEGYLGRVTKPRIIEAVREGASEEAASRITGLKKGDMVKIAEEQLAGSGWLPSVLKAPEDDIEL
jgi:ParB family chromosome partitioning protein